MIEKPKSGQTTSEQTIDEQFPDTRQKPADAPQSRSSVGAEFFMQALEWELHRAHRSWEPFLLVVIEAEEQIRENLEAAILATIRECDLAATLEAERIAVLLIGTTPGHLPAFTRRVGEGLSEDVLKGAELRIGSAAYPNGGETAEALIRTAVDALRSLGEEAPDISQSGAPGAPSPRNRGCVLVVDDDLQNRKVLDSFLRSENYCVTEAENGEQALAALREQEFDLVLLDVMMPGMNGFEVCRRIKSRDSTRFTPVILVTALDDSKSKIQGIESGTDDFLTKPFDFEELSARSASLIRLKTVTGNMTGIENVLLSLAAAVEAKDRYTQGHTDRASRLAMKLGMRLGLSREEIDCLRIGGILHDVGKIGVPEQILNKEGPLSEEEWKIMRTHPEIGYRICESLSRTLGDALEVILHHHEKLDGTSYPDGLRGEQVIMVSRIMGAVDIYDALITDRPYRRAMSQQEAFEILRKEASEGKLDPKVVENLIDEVEIES
jgi:putative two-component system response regulator